MALRFDSRTGRLVQESEEDRLLREGEMRAQQERWYAMRLTPESDRRTMVEVANAKKIAAARNPQAYQAQPLTDLEAQVASKSGKLPARFDRANTGTGTGTGGGSTAAARAAAMRAAGFSESEANRLAAEAQAGLAGLYDPMAQQAADRRAAELRMLAEAIAQSRGQITGATEELMRSLPQSTAFQDVPLVGLQSGANPLIAALQSQGAGTQEVESQRALSDALASQMRAMQERSATQYGQADQAYLDSLRRAGQMAGTAGQQYLSLREPEIRAGIQSSYEDFINQLQQSRATSASDITNRLSEALQNVANERADIIAKYGPAPRRRTRRNSSGNGGGRVPTLPDTRNP